MHTWYIVNVLPYLDIVHVFLSLVEEKHKEDDSLNERGREGNSHGRPRCDHRRCCIIVRHRERVRVDKIVASV